MRRGLLVALSGVDSSGKSTQIERLFERERGVGGRPVVLWTRLGYTRGLERAKSWLRRLRRKRSSAAKPGSPQVYPRRAEGFRSDLARRAWLTVALAELLWWYSVRARLWRARGRTVICDRYLWDCLVDLRVNFPDQQVERWRLARFLVTASPRPDVAVLLDLPVAESLRRSVGRERRYREGDAVLVLRSAEYRRLAREAGAPALDATAEVEKLAREIADRVDAARS